MSRQLAIERANQHFDSGEFMQDLARRVAIKTESQIPESHPFLRTYLTDEIGPVLQSMGYHLHLLDNPAGVAAPFLVARRIEDPALPTLTLRAAAILKGSYDGARLAAVGKDANGFEVAVVLGKQITPAIALWAEVGVQDRSGKVPNATFYELGARLRFAPGWSASLGYGAKKFSGNHDIGGPGFSPGRFQEVREERGVAKLGIGYAFAGNQGLALNLAKAVSGRNTVKDDQIVGLSYTFAF